MIHFNSLKERKELKGRKTKTEEQTVGVARDVKKALIEITKEFNLDERKMRLIR